MPNFISDAPISAAAYDLVHTIPDPTLRGRLGGLYFQALRASEDCTRPIRPKDLAGAHPKAVAAFAAGAPIVAFRACPKLARKLRALAADAARLCASLDPDVAPRLRDDARMLVAKCGRMALADLKHHVARHLRLRAEAARQAALDTPVCEAGAVHVPGGAWVRIRSLGELVRAGQTLSNCWARETPEGAYARRLVRGQIWVLRSNDGVLIGGLAAEASPGGRVTELRGPRNTDFPLPSIDLALFLIETDLRLRMTAFTTITDLSGAQLMALTRAAPPEHEPPPTTPALAAQSLAQSLVQSRSRRISHPA